MCELQRLADLRVGDDPFMQQQVIGGYFAAMPGDAFDLPPSDGAQPPHAPSHRNSEPAQFGDHGKPLAQIAPPRPPAAATCRRAAA